MATYRLKLDGTVEVEIDDDAVLTEKHLTNARQLQGAAPTRPTAARAVPSQQSAISRDVQERRKRISNPERPSNNNKQWTEDDTNIAISLRQRGSSYEEIGKVLGRSAQATNQHLSASGLIPDRHTSATPSRGENNGRRFKHYTTAELTQMIRMYQAGERPLAIAKALNRTTAGVAKRIKLMIADGTLKERE